MGLLFTPKKVSAKKLRGAVDLILRGLEKVPLFKQLMCPKQGLESSDVPITLVIPLHRKDLWIVPYALEYALKNIRHPIVETVIVSADHEDIRAWCEDSKLRWVHEDEVLGYSVDEIESRFPAHSRDRSKWVFQQLLKLAADNYVRTESFLVLDSDTLLLTPKVFHSGDHFWQEYSHERNMLYLKSYRLLLGKKAGSLISYVCHYMYAEKRVLKDLLREIESQTGKLWDEAIIELAGHDAWDDRERSLSPFNYFSEYETYGNFAKKYYKNVHVEYFRGHACKEYDPDVMSPSEYVESLPVFYKWASFHSYFKYKGKEFVR